MTMNTNEIVSTITPALQAGQYAKAWTGKYQDRIYIREGKREICHYELYPPKGVAVRNGKNFGMYDQAGNFLTGSEEDFGATQIIAAGYCIQRGA
jgi:hypothetical protein